MKQSNHRDMIFCERVELGDQDRYLFNEGTHQRVYQFLGAHRVERVNRPGVTFGVWAPNAGRVQVIGDFNGWGEEATDLHPSHSSGIWTGFVPGLERGTLYKYRVHSRHDGYVVDKADPVGFLHELPPRTASVVWDLDYQWNDAAWMRERKRKNALDVPMSIYELHLGSWKRRKGSHDSLSYRELAVELAQYVSGQGFTHVELLPPMEHPFYPSWGYQTTGYFAPTSRYGTPQDFMYLVDMLHQHGVGVYLDWSGAHFPSDQHGLSYFDGTHLYEHADPRLGYHPDWHSCIFNYGRDEVRSFLTSSVLFWLEKYHVDGMRFDGVASMLYRDYSRNEGEWIPNVYGGRENFEAIALLQHINIAVFGSYDDVQTIAEESTSWAKVSRPVYSGGLGFGMKWDMGWMHDTLKYMENDPIHRKYHHGELTFRGIYAQHENFVLPLSHDEVVHGKGSLLAKMPGDDWQKFANLRLLYAYMWSLPAKKLLFMGGEIGQWSEWSVEGMVEWSLLAYEPHQQVQALVRHLNQIVKAHPALYALDFDERGFSWLELEDGDNSILAYLRRGKGPDERVIVVLNFTPVPRTDYRVAVESHDQWEEFLNTDANNYGGSGVGNPGVLAAEPIAHRGRASSLRLSVPPLAALFLRPV